MINIESISKGFGGQELFSDTGLQINPGEKIGLVGRNGHGKTTLLRMITGREEPETGAIRIPGDYRLGYLTQHIDFSQPTVLAECMQGLNENERDHSWKAEKILAGLGFSPEDMQQHPGDFSGGFQVRLTLAKVLVSEPDLLILDEPTNYLDITSIRWIAGFLRSWPREILLVTHDRSFMDSVVTHIAGIHRRVIRKIAGTTDKYYEQIVQDEEIYEKTRLNDEKRRREMELFITRFRAKARLAGMVQSRIKALSKMEKRESLSRMESLAFSFRNLAFAGKQVIQVDDLCFAHDPDLPLIRDFNFTLAPGDRVAIIGKNGKGKTTLLKLLAQKLTPDSGRVTYNPGVEMGYFEQTNVQSLNPTSTVEEEILLSHPDLDRQQARNICGAIMFEGDNALKRISVLSGGEKSRVMLGKLLAKPLNLVLLDEPTNHLDMESCDSLVVALDNFEGAVVLVTHNEMFLHALANRLIVFKNDTITLFEGNYGEFLDKEGWDEEAVAAQDLPEKTLNEIKISKKELRKVRSDIIAERSRQVGPLKKKVQKIEDEIEEHETILEGLNAEIQSAVDLKDGKNIARISCAIGEHQTRIDELFDTLEKYSDELDEQLRRFDEQLNEL
ncbi:ATP-type transporter, ATP binding protein (ATPase) [Desulforapulum autotrophicum HRM2]|uniref:ATP-type transporter, ATP binding protein (ATPase) n=1 Tax=Desulforapulum autotrophicum (strain ATCC 43914 / DSM 3382 / VKM B-1955 / HRM2) TaxID=177437 RepID=C0QEQ9_DESAH|nr:ABC-F family ATP-binding cassette domain-containing protein [Desulforapulum autotrophicum]ACN15401.1 ATP-type transporter, ATP binding protein (ATPase) [Desulforapulum autotrophicum HRM2]